VWDTGGWGLKFFCHCSCKALKEFVINRAHKLLVKGPRNLNTLVMDQTHNKTREGKFSHLMRQTTQSHMFKLSGDDPSNINLPSLTNMLDKRCDNLRGCSDMTLGPHIVHQEFENESRFLSHITIIGCGLLVPSSLVKPLSRQQNVSHDLIKVPLLILLLLAILTKGRNSWVLGWWLMTCCHYVIFM